MKLEIDKVFEVEKDIQTTWEFLSDPVKVVTCVPGAKLTEMIDESNFNGVIEVKIGPVLTKYQGKATLALKDDKNHKLSLEGKGIDSKGQGSASMNMKGSLTSIEGGGTKIESTMSVNISGKLAQIGSRMIKAVSNEMFERFRNNVIESLENPDIDFESIENKPIKGINLVMGTIGKKITSPFRKSSPKDKREETNTDPTN